MINTKRLVKMARKWRKFAVASRKRISLPRTNNTKKSSVVAEKGQFVIYTTDGRRFRLPLSYLEYEVVRELHRMSEQEFGLASDAPITLPCDSAFMECVISMIQHSVARNMETAMILSLSNYCCSNSASLSTHIFHEQIAISR